jgi:hypothetical protein
LQRTRARTSLGRKRVRLAKRELASFGETHLPGVLTLFGTQHIKTGIGFVRGNCFLGDFARLLDSSLREPHWVRLAERPLASFGEGHPFGVSTLFGTQHIRTGQWVRLGKPNFGRCRRFTRPILPSLPTGSFGKTGPWLRSGNGRLIPNWLRSGKVHSFGASTPFGTQHIRTGQWVRLGELFSGRFRRFTRPILPSLPMGSFGRTVIGFVRGSGIGFVRGRPPMALKKRGVLVCLSALRG